MKNKILIIIAMLAVGLHANAQQDSLATYILSAAQNNPAVIGGWKAYRAQVETANGAGQLSDPELSLGFYPSPMEHVNSKQLMIVQLMQMFPWFGTLKAARNQLTWKAEAAYQKFREDGINLAFQVQQQWYDMLVTRENISSVKEQLAVLKDIEKTTIYQYKSSLSGMKGSRMSDQMRLQAEETKLEEQIESLEDKLKLQQEQFNLLMHREPGSQLVLPDSILMREINAVAWNDIESNNPALTRMKAEGEAYKAMGERAKAMGKPMIGVGIQYMLNGKVDMPRMADMNGMDMVMPMVKLTLPIYRKKVNSEVKAAGLMQESTADLYQRQKDVMQSQWLSIQQRANDVKRKIALYDKEVSILSKTLQLMQQEYISGNTSITDILQTSREEIDYALKKAEAKAQYNVLVAEYEKLASMHDYATR